MKCLGLVAGLAALAVTGSANAATIYDSLTGQTGIASSEIATNNPLGADFSVSYTQTLDSVTLGLVDKQTATGKNNCGTSTIGAYCTDSGSVMVYLVQSSSGLPSMTSGLTLSNPILLGTVLDTSLIYAGSSLNTTTNIQLTTDVTLTSGTYWIELVATSNSTAKWGDTAVASAVGMIGTPTSGWYTSGPGALGTIIGGVSSNSSVNNPSPNDEAFMMKVNTPEPATLSIIGAGLFGLGWTRRRKAKKSS